MNDQMSKQEQVYAEDLLAEVLLEGFRELPNPELARCMAKFVVAKMKMFEAEVATLEGR